MSMHVQRVEVYGTCVQEKMYKIYNVYVHYKEREERLTFIALGGGS